MTLQVKGGVGYGHGSKMDECDGKVGLRTVEAAWNAVDRLKRFHVRGAQALMPYRCRWCLLYHVGHYRKSYHGSGIPSEFSNRGRAGYCSNCGRHLMGGDEKGHLKYCKEL